MKRFNFLSMVLVLVVVVTTISCTTMTGTQDDYYSQQSSRRVYVDDPYRGTVVLERDPHTGRYYEVDSYGNYGRNPYNTRNARVYRNYGYRNNNGYRNNYPTRTNPNRNQQTVPQRQTEEEKKQIIQNRDDARKKVLGG